MIWWIIGWLICSILAMAILRKKDGPMPLSIWVILLFLGPIGFVITLVALGEDIEF